MDMATSNYSAAIHASMTCWTTVIFCLRVLWTTATFIPHFFRYWKGRAHFFYQESKLSWWWWLLIISAYWNEPKRRPGKANGTYWMLVRAEQYEILAECKSLARDRRRFERFSRFAKPYRELWTFASSVSHATLMLILNLFRIGYFDKIACPKSTTLIPPPFILNFLK